LDSQIVNLGTEFVKDVLEKLSTTDESELDRFDPVHHAKGVLSVRRQTLRWKIRRIDADDGTMSDPELEISLVGRGDG